MLLEVFPVQIGCASSRSREVDSTSLTFVHRSIQRKMRFRSSFVLLQSAPQAHLATSGSAPQTNKLAEDQPCRLPDPGCGDTSSPFFFSDRSAGDQSPCFAPDS